MTPHRWAASAIAAWCFTGMSAVEAQIVPRVPPCRDDVVTEYRSSRGNAYEVVGCGPSVLVLHGFSADRRMWRALMGSWRPMFRLVLVDLKSHGQSIAASADDDVVRDMLAILDEQRIERTVIIGHSMGAAIAVDLTARAPERVSALVMLSPSVSGFVASTPPDLREVASRVRAGDHAGATTAWLATPLMRVRLPATATESFRAMIHDNARVWQSSGARSATAAESVDARIAALRVPLLVGIGADDASGVRELAAAILRAHPSATFHIVPSAGHWFPLEAPDATSRIVTDFLRAAR